MYSIYIIIYKYNYNIIYIYTVYIQCIYIYSGTPLIRAVWDQELPISLKLPITLKAAELNS